MSSTAEGSQWWKTSWQNLSTTPRCFFSFCWPTTPIGDDNHHSTTPSSKGLVEWLDDDGATVSISLSAGDSTLLDGTSEGDLSSSLSPPMPLPLQKDAIETTKTNDHQCLEASNHSKSSLDSIPEKEENVVVELPLQILVSMIAPYISDRTTLNNFSMASKEVYQACLEEIHYPPWPSTMLNLRSRLWSVAFSPDNQTLAVGGTDGRIRLFDRRRGPLEVLVGHLGRVYSIVFTEDGSTMMTLSGDGDLRLWSMLSQDSTSHKEQPDVATLNPNSTTSTTEPDEPLYSLRCQVPTHSTHAVSLAYNTKSMRLATGGEGDIKFYSVRNGVGLDVLTMEQSRFLVESLAFSPNGNLIAAGTGGHKIHFWDLSLRQCVTTFQESSSVHALEFSPDGQYLVAGTDHRDIRLWNMTTGDYTLLQGHRDMVWSVAFSPTGSHIASASDDGTVRMWCVKSGLCTDIWNGHADASVYNVAFSPDGRTIASTSNDGYLELRRTRGIV